MKRFGFRFGSLKSLVVPATLLVVAAGCYGAPPTSPSETGGSGGTGVSGSKGGTGGVAGRGSAGAGGNLGTSGGSGAGNGLGGSAGAPGIGGVGNEARGGTGGSGVGVGGSGGSADAPGGSGTGGDPRGGTGGSPTGVAGGSVKGGAGGSPKGGTGGAASGFGGAAGATGASGGSSPDASVGDGGPDGGTTCSCRGPTGVGQIGVQIPTDSPCPSGYAGNSVVLQSGLTSGDRCTGCSCSVPPIVCSVEIATYCKNISDDLISGYGTVCKEDLGNMNGDVDLKLSDATDASRCATISGYNILYRVGPLTSTGGGQCSVVGAPSRPTVTWADRTKFCAVTSLTAGNCVAGQACAPPTVARSCILMDGGTATCPAGYTKQGETWYTGAQDGRSCSACQCGLTTQPSCGTRTVSLAPNGFCNSSSATEEMTNSRHCTVVENPVFTLKGNAVQGVCDAWSSVSGTVDPIGAKTLCCM